MVMLVLANTIDNAVMIMSERHRCKCQRQFGLCVLLWSVVRWLEPAPLEPISQVPSESLLHTGTENIKRDY